MAESYSWDKVPQQCTEGFSAAAVSQVWDQWWANLKLIDAEITEGRGGLSSLDARFVSIQGSVSGVISEVEDARAGQATLDDRLDLFAATSAEVEGARDTEANIGARFAAIENGSRLGDDAVGESNIQFANDPFDGAQPSWNGTLLMMEWITPGSATDTGEVRMNAADAKEYLEDKLGDGVEPDGLGNFRTNGKLAYATVASPHTTSGNEMIKLKQGDAITLNAAPADNETVSFMPEDDLTVTAAAIYRNGKTIVGEAEDLTVDVNMGFTLVFNQATNNWGWK